MPSCEKRDLETIAIAAHDAMM